MTFMNFFCLENFLAVRKGFKDIKLTGDVVVRTMEEDWGAAGRVEKVAGEQ